MNGAFPALYHDLTQYLFSALTVLAASSLLGHENSHSDKEWFEESVDLLSRLKDGGNIPAREYYRHVELLVTTRDMVEQRMQQKLLEGQTYVAGAFGGYGETGETALAEPLLEEVLMQAASEIPESGYHMFLADEGGRLSWPELGFQV